MRTIFTLLILSCSTMISMAQLPHLDVEGHVKIRGNIDINHMEDTTSLLIGRNAGITSIFKHRMFNTFVGMNAGQSNTQGGGNSIFGSYAGFSNTSGGSNAFFGSYAGNANTSGDFNSFFGALAGSNNSSGHENSFFGENAGSFNTSGHNNSFFGDYAGIYNVKGTRNTYIGSRAGQLTMGDSLDRAIAIGYKAKVHCNHCAVIGGTDENAVKVGIGTSFPIRYLTLVGSSNNDESDFAITSPDALIELGLGQGGPHGFAFGDQDADQGMKLIYRSTPNQIRLESGIDFSEDDALVVFGLNGNVGIGTSLPNVALDVIGSIEYTGDLSDVSDIRLKENIRKLENPLEAIRSLNGFTYNLIGEQNRSAGVSAQDVQRVLPEAVSVTANDIMGVDYTQLVPLLIEGIKEQQIEIDILKQEIQILKEMLLNQ